jgi:Fe2+ or Zn2+ uptake regulation protein
MSRSEPSPPAVRRRRSAAASAAAPESTEAPRRNRTRQREQLLAWLRRCDAHPTAAELHAALRPSCPRLSLGTVYRNLEVLVQEGEIEAVPCESGALRYDGNPAPHHHFTCERCGSIQDIALAAPRALGRRLEQHYALRAHRIRIDFIGLCARCADHPRQLKGHPRRTARHGTEGKQDASESEARIRR